MATVESPANHEVLRFFGEPAFEDWRLFENHFELAAGPSLLVLLLPGTAGALICEQALAERLANRNLRLERIRFSSASEIIRLGERLLGLSLDGVGGVWVSFLSPERTDDDWRAACGNMFTVLNSHRNRILKALPVPLVFVGEPWLQKVFREAAPDFWSVRSTVVSLLPQGEPMAQRPDGTGLQSQAAGIGVEAASDPDYTLEQAHRLALRKDFAPQRAELLMRAAEGFRISARLELSESCWREALNILSDASAMKQQPQFEVMRGAILNNLAAVLSQLGHREEALDKARRAVLIYEQLAKARPDAFLRDLAKSLSNLATTLSALGRPEEALIREQEAVRILEQLAKALPDAFQPNLATALNNLSILLGDLGRREEALDKAQQALRIREQLATAKPEVFLPDLAVSLNNLANRLGDLGRREEALDKSQKTLRIYEQLSKTNPDAFLPNLAGSLNNLADRLADLGRSEEALAMTQEAVRIYEGLAQARPDAILPELANSYGARGAIFGSMGRHAEATAMFAQGIRTITPLFQKSPAAFHQLIRNLSKDYRTAIQQAQIPPDESLLAPIVEVLDKLKRIQPSG